MRKCRHRLLKLGPVLLFGCMQTSSASEGVGLYSLNLSEEVITRSAKVLLVNPSIKGDPFWDRISAITEQAAEQLNITLDVIYGDGTRFFQLEELKKYFNNNPSPDYVVLINYPGHAQISMNFLQSKQVKVITMEQTISGEEKVSIGYPGQKYKNWIGEVSFDNTHGGYLLAKSLLTAAMIKHKKLITAGISGHYGSESALRTDGLIAAIKEFNAEHTQIVHANWSEENAYSKTLKLMQRYPGINVIWCASDRMALGAIKAIEKVGLTPGEDVFVGGFDWDTQALSEIKLGKVRASIGGHVVMGAISLVAIYNIENNISYQPFMEFNKSSFELSVLDEDNILQNYNLVHSKDFSHINFKKLAQIYSQPVINSKYNLIELLTKASY